jgi:hypothetical protein
VDCAGLLENRGTAIGGLRQPLENFWHGNQVSRRPLGKSRHGNRWIAPASWKIAAWQLVDCACHLKICGGGLATISKGRYGLRKRQIRIEHGAPLKREASGRIITQVYATQKIFNLVTIGSPEWLLREQLLS